MAKDSLKFRTALSEDVPEIVQLLADDPLGKQRENMTLPLSPSYYRSFDIIDNDPNNELIIALRGDELVGFVQIIYIPSLTLQGSWRAQILGLRVKKSYRRQGIGRELLGITADFARKRNCRLLQLTTDKQRPEAVQFYESLGFAITHHGMKKTL